MNTMLVFILVFLLICCIAATATGLPGNYAMMLVLVGFGLLDGFGGSHRISCGHDRRAA